MVIASSCTRASAGIPSGEVLSLVLTVRLAVMTILYRVARQISRVASVRRNTVGQESDQVMFVVTLLRPRLTQRLRAGLIPTRAAPSPVLLAIK